MFGCLGPSRHIPIVENAPRDFWAVDRIRRSKVGKALEDLSRFRKGSWSSKFKVAHRCALHAQCALRSITFRYFTSPTKTRRHSLVCFAYDGPTMLNRLNMAEQPTTHGSHKSQSGNCESWIHQAAASWLSPSEVGPERVISRHSSTVARYCCGVTLLLLIY